MGVGVRVVFEVGASVAPGSVGLALGVAVGVVLAVAVGVLAGVGVGVATMLGCGVGVGVGESFLQPIAATAIMTLAIKSMPVSSELFVVLLI